MDQEERENIQRIVNDIAGSTLVNKESYFGEKYPTFKSKYPNLFRLSCEGKIDNSNLSFMLAMLSKMENRELNQYDASAEVGQMLFSKYVEPRILPRG
jgi:hypothetical protein